MLNVTGNQDLCYYNFKCARRLGVLSSFNSVYSNIGYVMLGLLFLALAYRRSKNVAAYLSLLITLHVTLHCICFFLSFRNRYHVKRMEKDRRCDEVEIETIKSN